MRLVALRVPGFLLVLALIVASMAPVTAQQSDSVTVTGQIVSVPLSISISGGPVTFGDINYIGTSQAAPVLAEPFQATDNNGAIWVSSTPIYISVTSPGAWTSNVCVTTATGIRPQMFRLFGTMPENDAAANNAAGSPFSMIGQSCATPSTWWSNGSAGVDQSFNRYIAAWVQVDEAPGSMSATITFSVSAGG